VDQGGRLESLSGRFLSEPGGGEAPQLVVNQEHELRRPRIALFDRRQDAADFVHHGG
jgi:hypothetical protein